MWLRIFQSQQFRYVLSRIMVSVCINRSTCIWQSWWDFAMKGIYLSAQMFIYRHLTRTTLIRTFQRTKFIDAIPLRHGIDACVRTAVALSAMWGNEGIDILKIIFLTHGNRSHYTFLRWDEINYNTFCYMATETFACLTAALNVLLEWFLQIILNSRFAHYAYHTDTGAFMFIYVLDAVVRMWGRKKIEGKCHTKKFFLKGFLHSYAITINYSERKM